MRAAMAVGIVLFFFGAGSMPAWGHGGRHHDRHCHGCTDCSGCISSHARGRQSAQSPAVPTGSLETVDGNVVEVNYLRGAAPATATVEILIQSGTRNTLARLGPTDLLKEEGISLKEGDSLSVKGFWVDTLDGDLLEVTEIQKAGKTLRLRDARGRPVWR